MSLNDTEGGWLGSVGVEGEKKDPNKIQEQL